MRRKGIHLADQEGDIFEVQVANEDDMRRWSRGADGTFRLCGDESSTICSSLSPRSLQTADPIATELVKVVCLDNFLNVEEAVDVMLIQDFQQNDKVSQESPTGSL